MRQAVAFGHDLEGLGAMHARRGLQLTDKGVCWGGRAGVGHRSTSPRGDTASRASYAATARSAATAAELGDGVGTARPPTADTIYNTFRLGRFLRGRPALAHWVDARLAQQVFLSSARLNHCLARGYKINYRLSTLTFTTCTCSSTYDT